MKTPYLVQRGEINNPLAPPDKRLSEAVDLDYMGSAEFEFGALPRSLRSLERNVDVLKLTTTDKITQGDKSLRVLHYFDDAGFQEYLKFLFRMREGTLRLKETTRFAADYPPSQYTRADFWWDIENDVMWSFNKIFMNRLGDHLVASWKYMNEK